LSDAFMRPSRIVRRAEQRLARCGYIKGWFIATASCILLKLILRLKTALRWTDLNHLNSESFLQDCFARLHISLITLFTSVLTSAQR
jgi:hypothetical protein